MAITITKDLNVVSVGVPPVIHLSQYDSDFTLVFNLYASNGAFTVPTDTTAEIRGTKKDGYGYSANATIDITNKRVTVAGHEQMTACAGQNPFELVLKKNNKVLSTANFILDVEPAALDADTITDQSVLKELNAIIAGAATATQAAEDAEEAAEIATQAADSVSESVTQIAQNAEDIVELQETVEGIHPLTEDIKQGLLWCFQKVGWADSEWETAYNALYDALYPDIGLVYITAVYNAGTSIIYTNDDLDDLKAYLTVIGHYQDGATHRITSYSLVGTLREGVNTITVLADGKTTSFEVTVANALDRVVFENLSYRDIFVTGNLFTIGTFEGTIPLSTSETVLPNGDTYRINAGSPAISSEYAASGTQSLKSYGASSTQIVYHTSRLPNSGRLLLCACVKCDRYVTGNIGAQMNVNITGAPARGKNLPHNAVTSGFVRCATVMDYEDTSGNTPNCDTFAGTYSAANADGYIDNVVLALVPDTMGEDIGLQLYEGYVNIINAEV